MKKVSFIGLGKVGATLAARTAASTDFEVGDVLARSLDSTRQAVSFIGAGRPLTEMADADYADLWVIAVPDPVIVEVASALASSGALRPESVVVHCSGAYPSTILSSCSDLGCVTASVHPIRSFADPKLARDRFLGTVCAFEGAPEAVPLVRAWIEAIGGRMLSIPANQKLRYHAGHVLASNCFVALLDVALRQFEGAGVPRHEALVFLKSLLDATVENVCLFDVERALTGPVARGDATLVEAQMEVLNDEDKKVYALLSAIALQIAERRGGLREESKDRLRTLLRGSC